MAVSGGIFNYLTQSPAAAAVAVQQLLASLPPEGNEQQYSFYFSLAAKQAPRPYVVMHVIEALPAGETLSGVSALTDGEFQFDSYADDQVTARQLSQSIRDALKNFAGELNDGTTIQFYSVSMDADDPYELGGGGYVFRSVLRLRAFYTENAPSSDPFVGSAAATVSTAASNVALQVPYVSQAGNALLLFAGASFGAAGVVDSVVDSNGHSWTRGNYASSSASREEFWYIEDSAPISYVTVTFAGGGDAGQPVGFIAGVSEYSGVASVGASSTAGSIGSDQTISQDTTVADSTIVAGFFLRGDGAFSSAGQGMLRYSENSVQCSLGSADAMGGAPDSEVTIALQNISQQWLGIAVELLPE